VAEFPTLGRIAGERTTAMGIYDRDYYREESRRGGLGGEYSILAILIGLNVAVFVCDLFSSSTGPTSHWLSDFFGVRPETLTRPWEWWRLLTSGFTHSPSDLRHLAFNMIGLFFFGRELETLYGRRQFLSVYLVLIVLSSAIWCGVELARGATDSMAYGASGAVTGVIVLFALHFPNRTIQLFMILPMPAWVLGVMVIVLDLLGAAQPREQIAYASHLGGAALALLYYQFFWRQGRVFALPGWPRWGARRRFRVHKPEADERADDDRDLARRADAILEKISRSGEASLTHEERRTLEDYSRRLQRRKG
jgi:membrane associated rhomboid family serine protease